MIHCKINILTFENEVFRGSSYLIFVPHSEQNNVSESIFAPQFGHTLIFTSDALYSPVIAGVSVCISVSEVLFETIAGLSSVTGAVLSNDGIVQVVSIF